MDQKRSIKQIINPDEKEFGEAGQKASAEALEWMVYMFEPDPWLEISYLMQMQDPKAQQGSDRDEMSWF